MVSGISGKSDPEDFVKKGKQGLDITLVVAPSILP